jgi:hypothetical protein
MEEGMRIPRIVLAGSLLLASPFTCLAQDEATQPAQTAARTWLALTDGGQYESSWDHAAAFFKASITKAAWAGAVSSVRSPLGPLKARKLRSATFMRQLPGAPAGEYVVIQYETQFQNRAGAIETITPMRESDGSWKVSGYFIK